MVGIVSLVLALAGEKYFSFILANLINWWG